MPSNYTDNPKIPIKNLYYMLVYAFSNLSAAEIRRYDKEDFENLYDLFAEFAIISVNSLIKSGFFRSYEHYSENLGTIRGSINFPATIRNKINRRHQIYCDFDNYSENNLFNQIIKTTLLQLVKNRNVKKFRRARIKNLLGYFSAVDAIDLRLVRWSQIKYQRNNERYRTLIAICRYIYEGAIPNPEQGKISLRRLDDQRGLPYLYEKFVLNYYIKEFARQGIAAQSREVKWFGATGNLNRLPQMQTDITLEYARKKRILIIDTKCYGRTLQATSEDAKHTIHSGNLYQIFAYVKNREFEMNAAQSLDPEYIENQEVATEPWQISGMLLYARTRELQQPDEYFSLSGNDFAVRTLPLDQDFSKIRQQLDGIVAKYLLF